MNNKQAKKLRRAAKILTFGKPQSEYEKAYKRHKEIHKELNVNEKTK